MSYITPAQLADSPGAQEIAQCATPDASVIVAAPLMDAVLRGADTSAFLPADVAVAQQVLTIVNNLITEIGQLIDGFIGKRYELPLAFVPELLGSQARALVRYKLNKNQIADEKSNPIARDYRDAMNWLQLVAAGKFSLGVGDPTGAAANGGGVSIAIPSQAPTPVPGRTFDTSSLTDYVGNL